MTDPKPTNYTTIANFNTEYATLADCVLTAINEFRNRIMQIFLIFYLPLTAKYLLLPWSQYRKAPSDHPCHHGQMVFRGTLLQLREIAFSFPPDILASFPKIGDQPSDPEPEVVE